MSVKELFLRSHNAAGQVIYIIINQSPFRIGRHPENNAQISEPDVSSLHAEFTCHGEHWLLRDQRSTNGTFLNGRRLSDDPVEVRVGDVIHFATRGYQVVDEREAKSPSDEQHLSTTQMSDSSEIRNVVELINILNQRRTLPYFQPIRNIESGEIIGWESLGRAWTGSSIAMPDGLFRVAAQSRVEWQLSAAFRDAASECASCRFCWTSPRGTYLFLNVHPSEFQSPEFLPSLSKLHEQNLHHWFRMVIEISEAWVCHTHEMHGIVRELRDLGMMVAYDDFGTGQARIQELINVPPDFLKIDQRLITALPNNRVTRDLVTVIVRSCGDLQVQAIGEGIELESERQACLEMGITLGQGYGLGKGVPAFYMSPVNRRALPKICPYARMNIVEYVELDCESTN